MFPKARTTAIALDHDASEPVLVDAKAQTRHQLSPAAFAIWQAADGTRSVDAIVELVAPRYPVVDARTVLIELDRLADASLLEERTSPPVEAPVARRALLRTLATASLGGAVFLAAGRARAEANGEQESRRKQFDPRDDLRRVSEAAKKAQIQRDRLRLQIGAQQFDGTLDPASLEVNSDGKSDFLSLGFSVSTFGQKGGVKELADILKSSREKQVPVTLSWGADLENTLQGTFSDMAVGYSLFLPEGTPVRLESLATLKLG